MVFFHCCQLAKLLAEKHKSGRKKNSAAEKSPAKFLTDFEQTGRKMTEPF
jgi:hypothetical protein